uniref:G_PROTEIN_RECEP_F1_2 domain-containing protein n=1 Tax=Globodera pallida TaxID=36090 RepID=A0A183BRE7_GLOPA
MPQKYYFTTSKGEQEAILDGLATVSGRVWPLLASVSWIFLVYVSMLGYVSQFIYRYMTLNWSHRISARKYFLLLGTMLLLPLAYCVNLFVCYCPPVDHAFMDDQSVAEQLGLNLSDNILLAGYTVNDRRVYFGFYYIIIICTSGYITMFTLALLMHKFLKQRSKMGASSELTKKMIAMNKQIARNLIVQAK